jgi:hypothetical protein
VSSLIRLNYCQQLQYDIYKDAQLELKSTNMLSISSNLTIQNLEYNSVIIKNNITNENNIFKILIKFEDTNLLYNDDIIIDKADLIMNINEDNEMNNLSVKLIHPEINKVINLVKEDSDEVSLSDVYNISPQVYDLFIQSGPTSRVTSYGGEVTNMARAWLARYLPWQRANSTFFLLLSTQNHGQQVAPLINATLTIHYSTDSKY